MQSSGSDVTAKTGLTPAAPNMAPTPMTPGIAVPNTPQPVATTLMGEINRMEELLQGMASLRQRISDTADMIGGPSPSNPRGPAVDAPPPLSLPDRMRIQNQILASEISSAHDELSRLASAVT